MTVELTWSEVALGILATALLILGAWAPGPLRKWRAAIVGAGLAVAAFAAGRASKAEPEGPQDAPGRPRTPDGTHERTIRAPQRDDALHDALATSETIRKEAADEAASLPDPDRLSDSELGDAIARAVAADD